MTDVACAWPLIGGRRTTWRPTRQARYGECLKRGLEDEMSSRVPYPSLDATLEPAVLRTGGVFDGVANVSHHLIRESVPMSARHSEMTGSWWVSQREIGILGGLHQARASRATVAHGHGADAAVERAVFAWWEPRLRVALRRLDGRTAS